MAQKRVAIVTNTTVADLYLAALERTLQSAGVDSIRIVLPDGGVMWIDETGRSWFEPAPEFIDALE